MGSEPFVNLLRALGDRYRRHRVGRLQRALGAWFRLGRARFDYPRLIDLPPGRQVLVLSPHPDDDVLGVGGTVCKHAEAGCRVTSLVLTDGGGGAPGDRRAVVVHRRHREQQAAAALLGVEEVICWDEPDGGLESGEAIAGRLRDLLRALQPDLVYLPSFVDPHPDHRAVTPLLARALRSTRLSFACGVYETGAPIVPNVLVDVSAHMATKLQAVAEHRSQLVHVDYVDLARALGRWRSGAFSQAVAYAEAFFLVDVGDYLAIWSRVEGR